MSFSNLYYKRTASTAKACYVCYKPTTTVLATINTVDFLYTCPAHLSDSGFATVVADETKPSTSITEEEIAKVKAEWEEKQNKKLEKEKKAKEKEKEKEDDKGADKQKNKEESGSPKPPGSFSASPARSTPKTTHERYMLHRNFFSMRLNEHRRRRQAAQAKELAPRLPGAPKGDL